MFKSLKKYLSLPVQVNEVVGRDGAGDVMYGITANTKCYIEGSLDNITDKAGNEIVSKLQLFFDNSLLDLMLYTDVNKLIDDEIVFNGAKYVIKAISPSYYKGSLSMIKVYV